MSFNIDDLTLGQIKEIESMCSNIDAKTNHPMYVKFIED